MMPTNQHGESPHEYLRRFWPHEFTKRRNFDKKTENETYLQWLQDNFDNGGAEVDDTDSEDDDDSNDNGNCVARPGDSIESNGANAIGSTNTEVSDGNRSVRTFMEGMLGDEATLPYRDQVEKVAMFCEHAGVEHYSRSVRKETKAVALLDDRHKGGDDNPPGYSRPYLGPLDPPKLREALVRQRFRVEFIGNILNAFAEEDNDAERRVIFVTNLDGPTIEALAATASRAQAPTLKNVFYRYLTSRASMGVTIPFQGFQVFALEFHIPYYVLRQTNESSADTRINPDGTPLRKSSNFPFLSKFSSTSTFTEKPHSLYEAQVSIAVTGHDPWIWVAHGFVDTYWDSKESVDKYDQLSQLSWKQGIGRPDPLMAGHIDAVGLPVWDPRDYFLRVVRVRLFRVLREWHSIIDRVECEIQQSRDYHMFPLPSHDPKIQQRVRNFSLWNRSMVKLLTQLIWRLSDTVGAWDEFREKEVGYFLPANGSPTRASPFKSSLAAIEKTFSELRAILSKFQLLRKELCEDNPQGVHAHLSLENNESATFQRRTASHVEILTVITIIFYPLALAASLFSTQGVLPFTPSLAYFTYVLIILTILLVATFLVCSNWASGFRPAFIYAVDLLTFRARGIDDDDSQYGKEDGHQVTNKPAILKQSIISRGHRKVDVRTPGHLEEGVELENLRRV